MAIEERENRLLEYIRKTTGVDLDQKKDTFLYSWKYYAIIKDPEKFHNIAKNSGLDKLLSAGTALFFNLSVPSNFLKDHWIVSLDEDGSKAFLDKHGKEYRIYDYLDKQAYS